MRNTITVAVIAVLLAARALAGPAKDGALRDAALELDIAGVRAALERGGDANAVSSDARPQSPLGAMTMGMRMYRSMHPGEDVGGKALEIARLLFANGAKIGVFDRTILFFPIAEGNLSLVSLLLDKGASPTAKLEGYTPTQLAVKYKQEAVYDLLVSRGGIPVDAHASAQLALVEAAGRGDVEGMNEALEAGADINGSDADGQTALTGALEMPIMSGDSAEAVSWLLRHGADPNTTRKKSYRAVEGIPLHLFVVMNRRPLMVAAQTMALLLRGGAQVSGMDSLRRTPLHLAAYSDNIWAAEILIAEGARVMARDVQGRTPLDYAESAPMIRLLREHAAAER
jgi:ankyrin repeat protein